MKKSKDKKLSDLEARCTYMDVKQEGSIYLVQGNEEEGDLITDEIDAQIVVSIIAGAIKQAVSHLTHMDKKEFKAFYEKVKKNDIYPKSEKKNIKPARKNNKTRKASKNLA